MIREAPDSASPEKWTENGHKAHVLLVDLDKGGMPKLLTCRQQTKRGPKASQVAGFKSERWPE